ncbi:MAG TPA: hypothetical protein VFK12_07950 [Gammaproteobacteria bacterium]|nr:hypothetical protein [Gammaproteobacteria bacterium]
MGELNESQKRYVSSVLSEINHYLENIEGLTRAQHSLLHVVKDDISIVERAELAAFSRALRSEIEKIMDGLYPQHAEATISARWSIGTNLEFANVECLELTRSKLAGYGPLDEQAFQDLTLRINRLRQKIELQMARLAPPDDGNG